MTELPSMGRFVRRLHRFVSGWLDSYDHYRDRVACGVAEAVVRAWNCERGSGVDGVL